MDLQVMKLGNAYEVTKESDIPRHTYTIHNFLLHYD
jgi:hypothetical protein